ncbi:hypothetical protein MYEC719_p20115 (plasmid) [Escherichia coli]|nr:hypothetical protein MYEC719_p20115 [Escherichia coli]
MRSRHPGKRRRDVRRNAVSQTALRRCGGSLPVVVSGAIHLFKPLSPGAKTVFLTPYFRHVLTTKYHVTIDEYCSLLSSVYALIAKPI